LEAAMLPTNEPVAASSGPDSDLLPSAPRSAEETGLPFLFLVELLVKVLFQRGQMRLVELSAHLKLTISALDRVIGFARAERMCEVLRMGPTNTDADLRYTLTEIGRIRGAEFISRNAYAGAAPVTLAAYCAQVQKQCLAHMRILHTDMNEHFRDIVVQPALLQQLGAAMNSGRSMFIHGPAGSGKTYLAERLTGLLNGQVCVPHAVLVDGEIVQVYDPMVHRPEHRPIHGDDATVRAHSRTMDARWVLASRPAVLAGGELTLDMLDLKFDASTRFYQAPLHLKANNGIFIIDDLGRQRCSVIELLNRWIVPMDRRIDYLSLHTGYKFQVPFDVIVIFSSNFPPERLAEGSFLRRLGYKICVGALTEDQYQRVFMQVCEQSDLPYSADAFNHLLQEHHYKEDRPLLACYPRDILGQVRDIAVYEGREPFADPAVLDWAWNNYFTGSPSSLATGGGEQ
jgi:MoxR-like ATPase